MWSVTPYRLCDHRCVYCCTNVQGTSSPLVSIEEAGDEVRRFVRAVPDGVFLIGAFADGYPSVEADTGLTRSVVSEFVAAGVGFTIITKGDALLRDIDLLLAARDRCKVQISVCSADDAALSRIDGNAPSGSRRLEVLHVLHRAGVAVELNVLPWIPGLTDTAELIARVPSDVPINLSPLSFGEGRSRQRLLGRTFTRSEVWNAYLAAYVRFGHVANTSWVRPSLPPQENHPIARLPRR
jgi:DNA repair photolyase